MIEIQSAAVHNIGDSVYEASAVLAFLQHHNLFSEDLGDFLNSTISKADHIVAKQLLASGCVGSLFDICDLFEKLVNCADKQENGVVFTPQYIVDFIIDTAIKPIQNNTLRVIDPACGCGSFLLRTAEYLAKYDKMTIEQVVSSSIFGIDINPDNVRRCLIILALLVLVHGGTPQKCNFHVLCANSLTCDWPSLFSIESFDYIIGNPPYVNTHDMAASTIKCLKDGFQTTQKGTYNIYYAFIEQSIKYISDCGQICFILPNNYLTISSAMDLRTYLTENGYVRRIIDFDHNMVFAPVRTYNSILYLGKSYNDEISYSIIRKCNDTRTALQSLTFLSMRTSDLDPNGWHLLNERDLKNIRAIRTAGIPLKPRIKVGIATLKDSVYLLDGYDDNSQQYYKVVNGEKFLIEAGITRPIYKISEIQATLTLKSVCRRIIFPYAACLDQMSMTGDIVKSPYISISESELKTHFPLCYEYLIAQRDILLSRDKGKKPVVPWFGYGRTQGLNYRGKKLLFPTFSNKPKFMMEESDDALFCNGYAIIDLGDEYCIELLERILNSAIMHYYTANTSYAIEGNYRCYQKKYIQEFNLPILSSEEKSYILSRDVYSSEIDEFLVKKYGLEF
ncbi:MAG TPA: N-6 DNA methylase [Candidatus Limiplasma sp.]|nr:N-6 DNA methylase [Candidatus Limiplasma sp.]HPS80495.1 N-6 DNA methylase [Candidatus Limiplasma sp.]